jgi:hypothetical protein
MREYLNYFKTKLLNDFKIFDQTKFCTILKVCFQQNETLKNHLSEPKILNH